MASEEELKPPAEASSSSTPTQFSEEERQIIKELQEAQVRPRTRRPRRVEEFS